MQLIRRRSDGDCTRFTKIKCFEYCSCICLNIYLLNCLHLFTHLRILYICCIGVVHADTGHNFAKCLLTMFSISPSKYIHPHDNGIIIILNWVHKVMFSIHSSVSRFLCYVLSIRSCIGTQLHIGIMCMCRNTYILVS